MSSGRCRSAPRAPPECSTNSGARPLSPAGGTPPLAPPPSSSLRPDRNELIATLFTSHSRQHCELGARQGRDRAQGTRCPGNRAVVRARGDARADGWGCWEMAAVTSVVEMCHHVMFPWAGLLPAETERGSEWRAFCWLVCLFVFFVKFLSILVFHFRLWFLKCVLACLLLQFCYFSTQCPGGKSIHILY